MLALMLRSWSSGIQKSQVANIWSLILCYGGEGLVSRLTRLSLNCHFDFCGDHPDNREMGYKGQICS